MSDENKKNAQVPPMVYPYPEEDDGEPLSETLKYLAGRWKLILFVGILGLVVGMLFARYTRDQYKSSAMLQLDTKSKKGSAMADLGGLFEAASPAATEVELIKSLRVLMPVVERLHLNYSAEPVGKFDRLMHREGRMDLEYFHTPSAFVDKKYKWFATVTGEDSYQVESPVKGAKALAQGKVGETLRIPFDGDSVFVCVKSMNATPGQRFALAESSVLSVAEGLQKTLDVAEAGKNTNIIKMSYKDRYADRVAAILNVVAETYVRQNVEMHSAEAEKTLEFLEEQLPVIKSTLDSSEQLLTNYRNSAGTVDLNSEARSTLDRQVQLKTLLLQLEQEHQEKTRLYKEDHPVVKTIVLQQERLRKEIGQEMAKTKKLPVTQQEVLKLQQDVEINNQLYTTVLNNIQQLRVVRAGEIGNVRVVDPAYVHEKPAGPNRKLILAGGLGGGVALCCFILLFIRSMQSEGVASSSEIERETGVSVYAKIPKTRVDPKIRGSKDKRFVLAKADPEDNAVEKLRALRTSLEFSMLDDGGKTLMITGLTPGAGKSFVSLNLTYLLAQLGKRVLFVDCDLRKSRLSYKSEKGVSDIIKKVATFDEALVDLGDNAYYMPIGTRVPNPAELLASKAFGEFMETCKQKFDLVIVDTPPMSLVSDAQIIAKYMDMALVVLEFKKHSMEDINEALAQLNTAKISKKAFVLNHCVYESGYGYGYGYGYKYRYSSK